MTKDYFDIDAAKKNRKEIEKDFEKPDLAILFCTPKAANVISRAYTYRFGEPIKGFGSNGGCNVTIQYPFVFKKPTFTYSDVAWRKFTKMSDEELCISFPFESLKTTVEDLPLVADHYAHYGEGMDV